MELARKYGKRAVRRLAQLMRSKNERVAVAVAAAQALLDRGFGKPAQAVTGANGAPLFPPLVLSGEPISDAIHASMVYEQLTRNPSMDMAAIAFEPATASALDRSGDTKAQVVPASPVSAAPRELYRPAHHEQSVAYHVVSKQEEPAR
jgi:hypothetical protein